MDENENDWFVAEGEFIPATNTYVIPDQSGEFYQVNNFQRLADKLFGAVEMSIDNVTAEARIRNARNEAMYKQVSGQTPALLPAPIQSWITRNATVLVTLTVLGVIFFFGMSFLRHGK